MKKLNADTEIAKSFVSGCSKNGRYALYGFLLSLETKISFDRTKFPLDTYGGSGDYFFGYIVACFAIGLLDYNFKDNIITPTYFDSNLATQLKTYLNQKKETDTEIKIKIDKIHQYFKIS